MKKLISLLLTLVLCAMLCSCAATGPDGVLKAIDDHEYQKAFDLYQEHIRGNAQAEQEVYDGIRERIQKSYEDFNTGKLTYDQVELVLQTIRKAELVEESVVEDALWKLDLLVQSKKAFEDAAALEDSGHFLDAYHLFAQVLEEDSQYASAQERQGTCRESYAQAICAEVTRLLGEKAHQDAFDLLETALYYFPDHQSLLGSQEEIHTAWVGYYQEEIARLLEEKLPADAYHTAEAALLQFPEDSVLTQSREDALAAWAEHYRTMAAQLTAEGKLADAYNCLDAGRSELPDGSVLENDLANAFQKWKDAVLAQAEEAFGGSKKDYEAAIRVLQESFLFGEELEQMMAHYQSYAPFPLTQLEYTKKEKYIQVGASGEDAKDVNGKTYEEKNVICPSGGSLYSEESESEEDAYVTYQLNQEYAKLTGVLFRPYSSLSCTKTWEDPTLVKIYGDGVLLYEGPQFTQETYDAVAFEVDVTGVRELKIVMRGVWSEGTGWIGMYNRNPKVCVGDLIIRK